MASGVSESRPTAWRRRIGGGIAGYWQIAVAVALVVVSALYARELRRNSERAAPSPPVAVRIDDAAEVYLLWPDQVRFADGTVAPREGYGLAVLAYDDYAKSKEFFDEDLGREHFPILVSFNATGFDASGTPITARRCADGHVVYRDEFATPWIRLVRPTRDGGFRVNYEPHQSLFVSETEWVKVFLRLPGPVVPAAADKMTDAELDQLGVRRLNIADLDKPDKAGPASPPK